MLQAINSTSFYIVNWLVLLFIVWMVFLIRHMSDETLIKRETALIVGIWLASSFLQFLTFFGTQFRNCYRDTPVPEVIAHTYVITYLIIILRDLCVLGIMMFF